MIKKLKRMINIILCYIRILLTPFKSKAKVLNRENTPSYIVNNNLSFIRLGDGEFRIMLKKKSIPYQKYSNELRKDLLNILKEYKKQKNNKFLLAVPYEPFARNFIWCIKNDIKYLEHFGLYRLYFRWFMNNKKVYGCALTFEKDNKKNYEKLWKNNQEVIFVHNNEKWAKMFENKYNIKTHFIKIPEKNAYEEINKIEEEIKEKLKYIDKNIKYSILISAGPCAKVLVYRLLKSNIIAYDIGHCWDEPLIMPK